MKGTLPPLMLELTGLIGYDNALKLVDKYGGIRCYVPNDVDDGKGELRELIGKPAATKLAKSHGGDWLKIPRCAAMLRAERDRQIREEHAQGLSFSKLARKYQMTERTIFRIVGKPDAGPVKQGSLF